MKSYNAVPPPPSLYTNINSEVYVNSTSSNSNRASNVWDSIEKDETKFKTTNPSSFESMNESTPNDSGKKKKHQKRSSRVQSINSSLKEEEKNESSDSVKTKSTCIAKTQNKSIHNSKTMHHPITDFQTTTPSSSSSPPPFPSPTVPSSSPSSSSRFYPPSTSPTPPSHPSHPSHPSDSSSRFYPPSTSPTSHPSSFSNEHHHKYKKERKIPYANNFIPSESNSFKKSFHTNSLHFPDYVSVEEAETGIEKCYYFKGLFRVNAYNRSEAYVSVEGLENDILIYGIVAQNRAVEGDIVAIEIHACEEWTSIKQLNSNSINQMQSYNNNNKFDQDVNEDEEFDVYVEIESKSFKLENKFNNLSINEQNENNQNSRNSQNSQSSQIGQNSQNSQSSQLGQNSQKNQVKQSNMDSNTHDQLLHQNFNFFKATNEQTNGQTNEKMNEKKKDKRIIMSREEVIDKQKLIPDKRITAKIVCILSHSKSRKSVVGVFDVSKLQKYNQILENSKNGHGKDEENDKNDSIIVRNEENKETLSSLDGSLLFTPIDLRYPKMIVHVRKLSDQIKSRLVNRDLTLSTELMGAEIVEWRQNSRFPHASIIDNFGPAGNIESETAAIMFKHSIHTVHFDDDVLSCLPSLPWTIPPEEVQKRNDFRHLPIFTVDPASARDLDDALSVEKLPGGNIRVGVHIADVSYFVQPDSALDLEARNRSTSVYLVQKVLPMLPRQLCEDLCSLNPGVDRLSFSVMWEIDDDANVVNQWTGRSIIRSCCKLAYDDAQEMIDGTFMEEIEKEGEGEGEREEKDGNGGKEKEKEMNLSLSFSSESTVKKGRKEETISNDRNVCDKVNRVDFDCDEKEEKIAESRERVRSVPTVRHGPDLVGRFKWKEIGDNVRMLWRIASILRKRRFENGALKLDKIKLLFSLNDDDHLPHDFHQYMPKDANAMIEEFMLLANKTVARIISSSFPSSSLLRRHSPPNERKLKQFEEFCMKQGYGFDSSSSLSIHRSLKMIQMQTIHDPILFNLFHLHITKPMQLAQYFCTGEYENERKKWKHYALSTPYYTHFTSPIRRYPDIVVHRLLHAVIEGEKMMEERMEEMLGMGMERMNIDEEEEVEEKEKMMEKEKDAFQTSVCLNRNVIDPSSVEKKEKGEKDKQKDKNKNNVKEKEKEKEKPCHKEDDEEEEKRGTKMKVRERKNAMKKKGKEKEEKEKEKEASLNIPHHSFHSEKNGNKISKKKNNIVNNDRSFPIIDSILQSYHASAENRKLVTEKDKNLDKIFVSTPALGIENLKKRTEDLDTRSVPVLDTCSAEAVTAGFCASEVQKPVNSTGSFDPERSNETVPEPVKSTGSFVKERMNESSVPVFPTSHEKKDQISHFNSSIEKNTKNSSKIEKKKKEKEKEKEKEEEKDADKVTKNRKNVKMKHNNESKEEREEWFSKGIFTRAKNEQDDNNDDDDINNAVIINDNNDNNNGIDEKVKMKKRSRSILYEKYAKEVMEKVYIDHHLPVKDDMIEISKHCNERKNASKCAQEASEKIFLCVMLKQMKGVISDARVISIGPKFMSVYICEFGIEKVINFSEIAGITTEWFAATGTLVLDFSSEEKQKEQNKKNNNNNKQKFKSKSNPSQQSNHKPKNTTKTSLIAYKTEIEALKREARYDPVNGWGMKDVVDDSILNSMLLDGNGGGKDGGKDGLAAMDEAILDYAILEEGGEGSSVEAAVLPLTLRTFSSLPVYVFATGGGLVALDVGVKLYIDSYLI